MVQLVLCWDHRKVFCRRFFAELFDVCWSHLGDVGVDLLLHLLYQKLVADHIRPVGLDLIDGFLEIFLRFLLAAKPVHHVTQAVVYLLLDLVFRNHERIQMRLGQEQFGRDHVFQNLAAGIALHRHAAGLHHAHLLLHVGEQDDIVAHGGYSLVYQAAGVGLRPGRKRCRSQQHPAE